MRSLIFLGLLGLLSCSIPGAATEPQDSAPNSRRADDNSAGQDLTYYLSQIAGVRVEGTGSAAEVQIRGQSTFTGESRPLYVLDGQNMGHEYAAVYALVNPFNIDRVTVLKDGHDTSMYGLQGANGVIVIETKERAD